MKNKSLREFTSIKERREYLEKIKGMKLTNTSSVYKDWKQASERNCENMIGIAQVPLGVAGPLKINGSYAKGEFFIPLATTEGALVASVNRGCKAVSQLEGVTVAVENVGATRGSVFETNGIKESLKLKEWFDKNFSLLKKQAESTSGHLTMKKIGVRLVGKSVYVRFYYDTQDAMGLNMVTIATSALVLLIEQKTKAKCISVAGNFDIDKKPAWLNFILGRGKRIWAEALIKRKTVEDLLKTTPEKLSHVAMQKYLLGSIMSGSLGFNGHYANILAALFIATGQDPAHVVEGSMGVTTTEVSKEGNLYFSVYLPDLMVGTVGGGTGLATSKEALTLLGVYGGNNGENALAFAEIIGGAVLAGELSLLASLAEGSLARVHALLGRGKKI